MERTPSLARKGSRCRKNFASDRPLLESEELKGTFIERIGG
jgi:hypothetical protein